MFRGFTGWCVDSQGLRRANPETWGCERFGMSWGLEIWPLENGHNHFAVAAKSHCQNITEHTSVGWNIDKAELKRRARKRLWGS
jgi:hypothetical protein